jgi:hypothetical protein
VKTVSIVATKKRATKKRLFGIMTPFPKSAQLSRSGPQNASRSLRKLRHPSKAKKIEGVYGWDTDGLGNW